MVELYYNKDHSAFAVLVSNGYGSGWSTWNAKELAYDRRVIEWYLEHSSYEFCNNVRIYESGNQKESAEHEEAVKFFASIGYNGIYFGGYKPNMLKWVPVNKPWRITEYDGSESIEYLDMKKWNVFN